MVAIIVPLLFSLNIADTLTSIPNSDSVWLQVPTIGLTGSSPLSSLHETAAVMAMNITSTYFKFFIIYFYSLIVSTHMAFQERPVYDIVSSL